MGNAANFNRQSQNTPNHPSIKIQVNLWNKDSYGLFDYECKQLQQFNFNVHDEGVLMCKDNECIYQTKEMINNEEFQIIFGLVSSEQQFILYQNSFKSANREQLSNKMIFSDFTMRESLRQGPPDLGEKTLENDKGSKVWIVVRSIQNLSQQQGFKLQEGDTIKIGRVKLQVKQIVISSQEKYNVQESLNLSICSQDKNEHSKQCRICFSTSNSIRNPLISPCKCSGTMQYIHLMCLKTWLKIKIYGNQNPFCTCFIWKQLECELCKTKLQPQFECQGQSFDLIEISKPDSGSYLILEMFNRKSQNETEEGQCLGIFILNLSLLSEQRVGRSHENELRNSDISVSRLHCIFRLVDGNVYLIDKNSKFGTLVRLKNQLALSQEIDGIEFQIGRSLVKVSHFETQKSNCCFLIPF